MQTLLLDNHALAVIEDDSESADHASPDQWFITEFNYRYLERSELPYLGSAAVRGGKNTRSIGKLPAGDVIRGNIWREELSWDNDFAIESGIEER